MIRKSIVLTFLIIVLVCSPFLKAQTTTELPEIYDFAGPLTFNHPADWGVGYNTAQFYTLANSFETLSVVNAGRNDQLTEDDVYMFIFPLEMFLGELPAKTIPDILDQISTQTEITFEDIEEFEINEQPAIKAMFEPEADRVVDVMLIVQQIAEDEYVVITINALPGQIPVFEEEVLSIAATIAPRVIEPLPLTQTYEDAMITFEYPEGWVDCGCPPEENVVMVGNSPSSVTQNLQHGDIQVAIFKSLEEFIRSLGGRWQPGLTLTEAMEQYFFNPDNETLVYREIIKHDLDNLSIVTMRYESREIDYSMGGFIEGMNFLIPLENDEIAVIMAYSYLGTIDEYLPTLLELAQTIKAVE